jgi:Uma2 family endonuclease
MSTATPVSAEQLLRMPESRCRYELAAGQLKRMRLNGWRHGAAVGRLDAFLHGHVHEHKLGLGLCGGGFLLARDPDTVLAPDIAFIRADRLSAAPPREAFWPGAPDLAVEVLSPADTVHEVHEKAIAWLDAGAVLVWVVNPAWRTVTIYRSAADVETLSAGADLHGESLLPGFRCPIADLFATP